MEFIFNHLPIAKMRHRHTKGGWSFDPQDRIKREVRKEMSNLIHNELNGVRSGEGRVCAISSSNAFVLRFVFEFPVPKSDSSYMKNLKLWGFISHNKKPDLSNLIKFYEDCANGILFPDDAMIVRCQMQKRYSLINEPRVIMIVEPEKEMGQTRAKDILQLIGPHRVRELMKACHAITTLPLASYQQTIEANKDEYLEHIAMTLMKFADEWAPELNKIKKTYCNRKNVC